MMATNSTRTRTGTVSLQGRKQRKWRLVRDTDFLETGSYFTNAPLAKLALRRGQNEHSWGMDPFMLGIWEHKLDNPGQAYEINSDNVQSEPTILYEDETSNLASFFNANDALQVSGHGIYVLNGSDIKPLPRIGTSEVPPLTTPVEQQSGSSVLPSPMWPETGARIISGGWIGTEESFPEHTDPTIALLLEHIFYFWFTASNESQYIGTNHALATLQAANPSAAERIKRLASLEPGWDGCGGVPPTQKAVKATAELLLEAHSLTGGLLESPFIAPLPEGGLELEWELDSGAEMMLVIPPTGTDVRYLLDEPTSSGDLKESEGIFTRDTTLNQLISRLTQ